MNEVPRGVLLWLRHAPYSTVHLSEAVRVATMTAALGVPVRLLFIADGVRALVQGQEPHRLGPPIEKTLAGVVTEEAPALVHNGSLDRRRIPWSSLVPGLPVESVDDRGAAEWVLRTARVVPF